LPHQYLKTHPSLTVGQDGEHRGEDLDESVLEMTRR
jgi:hypothetical protein